MKRKVILLYDFLKEMGGIERVMISQANALSSTHDVELKFSYLSKKKGTGVIKELRLAESVGWSGISERDNEIYQLSKTFLCPNRLRKVHADLLISHSMMSTKLAAGVKKKNGAPYFVFLHHPPNFLYDSNWTWANNLPRKAAWFLGKFFGDRIRESDREAVIGANKVFVNSLCTARRVEKIYGISPKVIYPPISPQFKQVSSTKSRELLKEKGINKNFIFLHGRIIKDKRPDFAIEAFYRISKKFPELDLVISGTIEEEKLIRQMVSRLNLRRRVKLLGVVSEDILVALYNSAECFLMTAPCEDFGLTPVEAMACGCPAVGWKDGFGPQETIIEGVNGFLATPYSLEDYSSKISLCLNTKFNKSQIIKSVEKFSEERISSELIDAVNQTLK